MKKNRTYGPLCEFGLLKMIKIMRFTPLILLLALSQAFAVSTYSQQTKISLDMKNARVEEVIDRIEKSSEFFFMYNKDLIDVDRKVDIQVTEKSIDDVLAKLFDNTTISFSIKDRQILLINNQIGRGEERINGQQQKLVTGKVSDSSGTPLPGVSVVIKGTTVGTITDFDGKFNIPNVPENSILVFSFVGMRGQEIAVSGKSTIDVSLAESAIDIEEVVAVGYGTQRKENLTGAVSQVKMETVLGDRPVMNTTSALQGAIPGLQITRTSTPGQNNNTLNIRGTLSINGGSPLVLIDGAPGELSMLNPDDIETISVLKDAASSAIYGAQAAGGVVLINTKHPKSGAKFRLDYNMYYGFETSINKPEQTSLVNYLQAYIDAGFTNTYWSNSQDVQKWIGFVKDYQVNPGNYATIGDGIYVDNGIPYFLNEKDLYNNFLTTGATQTHNVSASGGTSTIRYRISAGFNDENGPLITNKDAYKRMNAGAFISADVTDWFTQEVNIRYAQGTKNMYVDEVGGIYTLRLNSYYPEGDLPASLSLNHKDTPLLTPRNIVLNSNTAETATDNPRVMLKSIIKPIKDLKVNVEYTFDKTNNDYNYYSGKQVYTSIQLGEVVRPNIDYLIKRRYFTKQNTLNLYGNYSRSFGEHNMAVTGGFNQESYYYSYINNRAESQAVPSVPSFGGATGVVTNTDSYSEYTSRSGFYRLNYNYKNKYLFESNGRYDGSSKFPKDTRFGFFPSFSMGWQIGKENFMGFATNWLQELKLRASYGTIGNQAIDPYQYSPNMEIGKSNVWANNMQLITTIGMPSLVSSDFTWETVTSLDFGTDFSMFKNRLSGTFDWYRRDTKDMLTAGLIQLPATVGADAPTQNSASMRTHGWELTVNWADKIGKLGYRIGLNLYDRKSWVTKYDNNESGLISDYYVGRNLGEIWGYLGDGYYSVNDFSNTNLWTLKEGVTKIESYNVKPGDVKFKNLNDDAGSTNQIDAGTSTISDPGDRTIIGNTTPRYQFGSNLGLNYAGFDLSIFLQGVGKRDYSIGGASIYPFGDGGVFGAVYYNQTDYWKPISTDPVSPDYMIPVNPNPKLFRIYDQEQNFGSNTRVSDKYLQNAAYLRVKNVTLSYSFPKALIGKLEMQQLKLFMSIENLATFTSLPKGYDPETISWGYPFYRTVSFGASVTF